MMKIKNSDNESSENATNQIVTEKESIKAKESRNNKKIQKK